MRRYLGIIILSGLILSFALVAIVRAADDNNRDLSSYSDYSGATH
ncbi:MAG TPA: hypothetical protein VG694_00660 [Candidatus Paceibacterota bacterium]|nr:hypothetical protein [Candidatus Paceibacterota bacterium]